MAGLLAAAAQVLSPEQSASRWEHRGPAEAARHAESESFCEMNTGLRVSGTSFKSHLCLPEASCKSLHLPEPRALHLQGEELGDPAL